MMRPMLLAAALAATLAAAPGDVQGQQPKRGGQLVYATGTDATTLDPQFITDVPTSRTLMHIHETLVYPDIDGKMQPVLAESWQVSADRLTWTFKLRAGVKFHDGTPFDAEAVKYTIERILDPATGSPRRSIAAAIKSVAAVDPQTVAITTERPFAPLLAQLSAYNLAIMSPAQAKKEGKDYARKPAGTGPYRLQAWTKGEKLTLVRNEDYWGEKPHLDRIEIRVVPEDSARVLQLIGGEADVIASVPPVMLPRLEAAKQTKVLRAIGYRTVYIGMNGTMKPWDDVRVRRALAHAIDADAIIRGVLQGVGTRGSGLESPAITGAHRALQPLAYDPAKAKALLAEAGFPDGIDSVLYTPTGRYLNDRQVAEAVQAQARAVGIRLRIETPEFAVYQQMLDAKDKIPVFLLGKGSPTGDLDLTIGLMMQSKGRMNYFGFDDAETDRLIADQRGLTDPGERQRALDSVQQRFHDHAAVIVLFYEDQLFAARANVEGVLIHPNEFVSFIGAWKR